jgi:hypothetical protein
LARPDRAARALGDARFEVTDYYNERRLGETTRATHRLEVDFERFLLLKATPVQGERS